MSVTVKESDDQKQATIHVVGRFDFSCHQEFSGAYKQFPKGERCFVVDLSDTEYMDSSSMGMLLQLKEYASNVRPVALSNANESVREILQIAHFDKLFNIE
ncbi:MAG: STAS domain-containing protein [Sedimenticola thiotaurini]|uniref:STAS domain-containing protein n=1 Tax=Sedimenticola thiotaurini TaxID=1543721 RepID=A0A558DD38_9GAMM|nr:STAS domain-containing protein [Sedimenticola sp.]TVT58907.1 MAG: STAS domain-containing protein [Sedimenticola thiotaurini]